MRGNILCYILVEVRRIREIVVVIVGCKLIEIDVNGYCYLISFLVVLFIKKKYV